MGLLTLVEDRPTPRAVYNWRVYACAAVASFASCKLLGLIDDRIVFADPALAQA